MHHPNCPLHDGANEDDTNQDEDDEMQEEDNQEPPVEINQESERKPADQTRMDVDTPKKPLSVKSLLNEEFNTIPIGCDVN